MTLTPAQQQGFEIGKLYRVFKNSQGCSNYQKMGQIVELTKDDCSDYPIFEDITSGMDFCIMLGDLEPYNPDTPETTYTIKKLSNQEFLLMYVQQWYPEDRVMIAMVESL